MTVSRIVLVCYSWLCYQLVWVICHLAPSVSNVTIICLLCIPPVVFPNSPRLHSRSSTLHHIHYSSQYCHLLTFLKSSSLCWWHSTLLFPSATLFWLKHRSHSKRSSTEIFILWLAQSPHRWTDFDDLYVMWRVFAQESTFWGSRMTMLPI